MATDEQILSNAVDWNSLVDYPQAPTIFAPLRCHLMIYNLRRARRPRSYRAVEVSLATVEPSRPEKILLAIHALSSGTTRPCRYEDIVVKAFELFPKEFQLRGHPQYPDSSDIHKPLYGPLKRQGLVRAAHKNFALTDKGLTRAEELSGSGKTTGKGSSPAKIQERLTRDMASEIARLTQSQAAQLFVSGEKDQILDTDFYSYIGVTVRTAVTRRNDFLGRLNSVTDAVETAVRIDPTPVHKALFELHGFLMEKFAKLAGKTASEGGA